MHYVSKTFLSAAVIVMAGAAAQAQDAPSATVNDPPGPVPDPGHIPFTPPDKVAWTGSPTGQQQVTLFGDPSKPGMYGVLIKWNPGAFSKPHFHDQERYIYVVSGTWWVASGATFNPADSVPAPGRQLRPPRCPDTALRRRQGRRQGAGDHRHLRPGADHIS